MRELELWVGAECTVNRVGDRYRDQIRATGLDDRIEHVDLFAEMGAVAVRFPILWERIAPKSLQQCNWDWSDAAIERLRQLELRAIGGLVHHGSGPLYCTLDDPSFPVELGRFAGMAAERYPWIRDWTPINEPLTTARFTGLYGHWYPHGRDEATFWPILLNQIEAVRSAMCAIRARIPDARLIQTDDLGRTYATAPLKEQAAFDNVRRWLGWDLLSGMVTPQHPLWERLCRFGLEERLRSLVQDPCPPDVIGINHYLTSDRFLDHRLQRYPPHTHGGNGVQAYADIEAVRALDPPAGGLRGAIEEAWERYRKPIAVTEVHNGCTREEQVRWVNQAWQTAERLRSKGAEVVAITAWSVFGSQGWNTLLTDDGCYEPGLFDLRGGQARPTALASAWKSLAAKNAPSATGQADGWWNREIRLLHPVVPRPAPMRERWPRELASASSAHPILITGATGTLGRALAAACRHRNLAHVLTSRSELDLFDEATIERMLDVHEYFAVINASGWVRVDEAEDCPAACMAANAAGAAALARLCADRGIPTVNFSSDLVFGDTASAPYTESAEPSPLNVYGASKLRMEQEIGGLSGDHLIVRTAAFFSPHDDFNFAMGVVRTLQNGQPFLAAKDHVVSPTYVPDLCNATLDLLIDGESGLWHLTSGEGVSWHDFALRVAETCGLDANLIGAASAHELGWKATRPKNCALSSEKGRHMASLESAIARFGEAVAVLRSAPVGRESVCS